MSSLSIRARVALMATVVVAATAVIADADARKPTIEFNAVDQAAATAALIRRSDLGAQIRLKGGRTTPDLEAWPTCPYYHPKKSDLVVTGAAQSEFFSESRLVGYGNQVALLKTPAMARLDWRRSLQPGPLRCMRAAIQKDVGPVQSAKALPIAPIGTRSAAFRVVSSGAGRRNLVFTLIRFFSGRTEVTISAVSPPAMEKAVSTNALRLARVVAARV